VGLIFRQTYLGINPTHDCLQAPLDCAFDEVFKNCAQNGNCGGMSLLALAVYKYGGNMGFCSPAKFYTGRQSPDREDLHRAINILQARQFSTAGIENIMDIIDTDAINDANTVFPAVEQALANCDYPLLSIANDYVGQYAYTVIPYKTEIFPSGNRNYGYPPGAKVMYIWDSNFPYDDNVSRYNSGSRANRLVIKSATNWSYTSGT